MDVVQLLLDRGAGINKPDTDGFTPLHEAAIRGQVEVVQFLIERGAELKGKSGREPYMGRRAKRYIDMYHQNASKCDSQSLKRTSKRLFLGCVIPPGNPAPDSQNTQLPALQRPDPCCKRDREGKRGGVAGSWHV